MTLYFHGMGPSPHLLTRHTDQRTAMTASMRRCTITLVLLALFKSVYSQCDYTELLPVRSPLLQQLIHRDPLLIFARPQHILLPIL